METNNAVGTVGVYTFEYVDTDELENELNGLEAVGATVISVYMTWNDLGTTVWVIYRDHEYEKPLRSPARMRTRA